MFGGRLSSTAGSVLMAEDGKAVMNLRHVAIGNMADGNLAFARAGGRLVANLAEMEVSGDIAREKKSYLEVNLKGTKLTGKADASVLTADAASGWTITGDSRVAKLQIAPGAKITAAVPVTVCYGQADGPLPQVENVTWKQDSAMIDDYEAKMMMPPPGEGPGGPGGPGMPPPPPMG